MQNLSLKYWKDLTVYLENREGFLCEEQHSLTYVRAWTECYHRAEALLDLITNKLNLPCDCKILSAGKSKLETLSTKKRSIAKENSEPDYPLSSLG